MVPIFLFRSVDFIIFFQDKVNYIIDVDILLPPHENASSFIRKSYEKYIDDNRTTKEIMLTFMESNK